MKLGLTRIAVALVLFSTGCAYFNVYYNAKQAFNDGEKQRQAGGVGDAGYRRAIDKCHALLRYHPNSGYVDDALFMIGLSHFHLKEYVQSQASFTDLVERFPESDFVERAWFYVGMSALNLGDTGGAVAAFDALERIDPKSRVLMEAEYRSAEVHLSSNYDTARSELTAFIDKYPRSEFARQAQVQVARTYYDQGRYEEATAAYEAALKRGLPNDLKYEASLSIALSLRERAEIILSDPALYEPRDLPRGLVIDLGQGEEEFSTANTLPDSAIAERQRAVAMLDEAARQLADMRKAAEKLESQKAWTLPVHDIEMAVTRSLQGSPDRAITDLDAIARSFTRTRIASDAYYEIAEIQRRQGDLDKARESYNQAARENGATAQVKAQATRKSQAIAERAAAMERLKNARQVLEERRQLQGLVAPDAADSVLTLQDPRQEAENQVQFEELATSLMRVAEIDLVELDQPRLALREYQMVLSEFPGTSQGPRALFAAAWIYQNRLGDRARALSTYRAVLRDYPDSPQARDALETVTAMTVSNEEN